MPNTLAPARKVNGLIRRLAALSETAEFGGFALERISRDASALISADPAGAHTVLGGVAALRGDLDSCQEHYRIALQIDGGFTHRFNYSVSLSHLEENAEALEVAYGTLEVYPDSIELVDHAITTAVDSGNFTRARDLCDRWDALSPERANPVVARARQLAAAIDAQLFGEQGVREVLRILSDVQRAERVRTSNVAVSSDDAGGCFLYDRFLHATPTLAAALNERVAERVAERYDLLVDPGLSFVVVFTGNISSNVSIP